MTTHECGKEHKETPGPIRPALLLSRDCPADLPPEGNRQAKREAAVQQRDKRV